MAEDPQTETAAEPVPAAGMNEPEDDGRVWVGSKNVIARVYGVAVNTVDKWLGRGGITKGAKGWDLLAIADYRNRRPPGLDGEGATGDHVSALNYRKAQVEVERSELELRRQKGELCERDEVNRVVAEALTTLRLLLENVADRAALCVPEEHRDAVFLDAQEVVDNALRTCRKALARTADRGKPLEDPMEPVYRWLDALPGRIAEPERTKAARARIEKRVAKFAQALRTDLAAGAEDGNFTKGSRVRGVKGSRGRGAKGSRGKGRKAKPNR